MKHYLSLGAGVQSSTMALMAAYGEIEPTPTAAVFADTGDEPASVYEWLNTLKLLIAAAPNPFPVFIVKHHKGKLSAAALKMRLTADGRKFSTTYIPFFTKTADGQKGMIKHRSCTADYKIKPILKFVRKHTEIPRGCKEIKVIQWIGISLDEVQRMKPARDKWAENRWPLIELKMSRHDCLAWMKKNNFPKPPRSSCIYCPFHNNYEWRRLKTEEPEEFKKAVEFERKLQKVKENSDNFSTTPYLHSSLVPLDQVDLSTDTEKGQLLLFNNECEGMCGV